MKPKCVNKKGQFSIIAALLIAIIVISAVIMTYANIRNLPFHEAPQVLSSLEEMNLSIKSLLEFSLGYYGSILQVTGNVSYAKWLTYDYFENGLVYVAHSHPEWNPSFTVNYASFSTLWYEPSSYSLGNLSVTYNLSGLGISGITYKASSSLEVRVLETLAGQSRIVVTREDGKPDLALGKENFFFYLYRSPRWDLISPVVEPKIHPNGTYVIQVPPEVEQSSYLIKVVDLRGMMTTAFYSTSGKPQYTYTITWNSALCSALTGDTIAVEAVQNGELRWLGQNLPSSTEGKPLLPIPVRALRLNQTINGIDREVPFQIEDWGSDFRVPLGLTSNASLLGDRQVIVFLIDHNVQKVTLWWDGRDTANQTPYAFVNRYFNGDNPGSRRLTNGILTLTLSSDHSRISSSIAGGSITGTASFLRINNENPIYGSSPTYVIHHGIVRDIIQQEAEWSTGAPNCPNVYSQMYFTLPANATYYTYALRTIFSASSQARTLTDLSAVRLVISGGQPRTENGTSGGYPVSSGATGLFYNLTGLQNGWAHHWSEFASGSAGSGIMFTDTANRDLYIFDNVAGGKTGSIRVDGSGRFIEFNPVGRSQYPASFLYALDVTWDGAVATFNGVPIYSASGNVGLWIMVEYPPTLTIE